MRDLVTRFREQAAGCRSYGSALTGALLEGAADDLEQGGVVADPEVATEPHEPGGPGIRQPGRRG